MRRYRTLIIGGVARAGKSILAQRVAERLNISRIPGDSFVSTFEGLYPEHGICHDAAHEIICQNVQEFFIRFWKSSRWDENYDFVFDTFHIHPRLLPLERLGPEYAFLFLGYAELSPEAMLLRARTHPNPNDWTRERGDAELLSLFANWIALSGEFRDVCAARGLAYIDTSHDFEGAQNTAFTRALELMKWDGT